MLLPSRPAALPRAAWEGRGADGAGPGARGHGGGGPFGPPPVAGPEKRGLGEGERGVRRAPVAVVHLCGVGQESRVAGARPADLLFVLGACVQDGRATCLSLVDFAEWRKVLGIMHSVASPGRTWGDDSAEGVDYHLLSDSAQAVESDGGEARWHPPRAVVRIRG